MSAVDGWPEFAAPLQALTSSNKNIIAKMEPVLFIITFT